MCVYVCCSIVELNQMDSLSLNVDPKIVATPGFREADTQQKTAIKLLTIYQAPPFFRRPTILVGVSSKISIIKQTPLCHQALYILLSE